MRPFRGTVALLGSAALLLPGPALAQAARATGVLEPLGSFWVTPYLGIGLQNKYYDGLVHFSNGGTDLLVIDPGAGIVFGVQVGYRFRPAWTFYGDLATSSPDAGYIENRTLRPDIGLATTQIEAGVLYDVGTFPVAGKIAPLSIGGGLSLTVHTLQRFTWGGTYVAPTTTSVGLHGLAALDIPLAPKVSVRAQTKLTVSRLARGDLEQKIAFAEGPGLTATLDGRTLTHLLIAAGITIRL